MQTVMYRMERNQMKHEPTTEGINAVAEVIRSVGFDAMADEFVSRPEYRERIVNAMTNNIVRDGKPDVARKFNRLARHVLFGTQVFL